MKLEKLNWRLTWKVIIIIEWDKFNSQYLEFVNIWLSKENNTVSKIILKCMCYKIVFIGFDFFERL